MVTVRSGWGARCWRLGLLAFLLVYLPLDACDADTSDTFEGGVVQIRTLADADADHTPHPPVLIVPEFATAAVGFHAVTPPSEPILAFPVARKPFSLPRSDDPHVTSLPPVKTPRLPFLSHVIQDVASQL